MGIRLQHNGFLSKLGIPFFKTEKFNITKITGPFTDGDALGEPRDSVRLHTNKYNKNWFQEAYMRNTCDRFLYWKEGKGSTKFLEFLIKKGVTNNSTVGRRRLSSSLLKRLADAQFPRETSSPIALHD